MARAPLLLYCDHRGSAARIERLEAVLDGFRVEVSRSVAESLRRVDEESPAVVVLDPLAPGAAEVRALSRAGGAPLPLLVVADGSRAAALLDALAHSDAGAALDAPPWDIVPRDASDAEIAMRVRRLAEEGRLRREMRELRHRASHDDRTDLLRGRAFEQRLVEHFSAAQRHGLDLALVMLDLDRFGRVNKEHDHTVGDLVIARVGEVVRRSLRTEDVAGRLGGDEFAVLLPYTRSADAARVVERLAEEIRRLSGRFPGAREPIQVSASIGYETFDGRDVPTSTELRQRAERALRAAKEAGGDRAIHYRALPDAAK